MALVLSTFNGSTWDVFDRTTYGFCLAKVKFSYSHPSELSFTLHAPQHTKPIADRKLVKLEDGATLVFLGHVYEIKPKESNLLEYLCYGPDMRARAEITIMSTDHTDVSAFPRRVYNCTIDNDDDYAFEIQHDANVGDILGGILTDAVSELRGVAACQAAAAAYESGDLTALDFIPQEKVVFESEKLGQGIDRLLNYYPAYRMLFTPSDQKWRLINVNSATQQTLTLNDFSGTYKVLSFQLNQTFEQRCTAFKIYGPQAWKITTVYSRDLSSTSTIDEDAFSAASSMNLGGDLTEEWSSGEQSNFEANGPQSAGIGDCGRKWSITDTDKNQISRILPDDVYLADSQYNLDGTSLLYRSVREPVLQATWDNDGANWWTVPGIKIDIKTGVVETPTPVYQYRGAGASPEYALPKSVRFIYAYFGAPVSVRKPSSSYEGTAYTVGGMQFEERLYDEMLSVGYEKGSPVVLATRTAQYEKLAQAYLDARKNIAYTGGCVLEGVQYAFLGLSKRINFAGVDRHGSALTTGWEAINAILTDVEIDYQDSITTLTFSSDLLDFSASSVDLIKRLLKIKALRIVEEMNSQYFFGIGRIGMASSVQHYAVDPDTGEVVEEY